MDTTSTIVDTSSTMIRHEFDTHVSLIRHVFDSYSALTRRVCDTTSTLCVLRSRLVGADDAEHCPKAGGGHGSLGSGQVWAGVDEIQHHIGRVWFVLGTLRPTSANSGPTRSKCENFGHLRADLVAAWLLATVCSVIFVARRCSRPCGALSF